MEVAIVQLLLVIAICQIIRVILAIASRVRSHKKREFGGRD